MGNVSYELFTVDFVYIGSSKVESEPDRLKMERSQTYSI
jgi:hypothetical protein